MTFRSLICVLLTFGFALSEHPQEELQAQEQLSESQWKRGYHGFHLICDAAGLTPTEEAEFATYPPTERVLVVLGDLNRVPWIDRFLERGGAVLAASDQQAGGPARLSAGIRIRYNFSKANFDRDRLFSMDDCPLVTDIRHHPAFDGVATIATNRPGILEASRTAIVAFFPPLQHSRPTNGFVASIETRAGGRLLAVADQSIFTNQMIAFEDNDLFAYQSLMWLKGENRKHVLVINNGSVLPPIDPTDVELSIPPPSREEVIEALKNLPPSALLEFLNSVTSVVEDQNMVNEFIHDNMDKVSEVKLNRFLIFLFFGLICLSCVVAFVWQKKLLRQTASIVASERKQRELKQRKSHEAHERQWAAGVLLDSICIELANRRYNDWPGFPQGLDLEGDVESNAVFRSMTKASNHFKSKPAAYWNRKRLLELEQGLFAWRVFFHRRAGEFEQDSSGETINPAKLDSP